MPFHASGWARVRPTRGGGLYGATHSQPVAGLAREGTLLIDRHRRGQHKALATKQQSRLDDHLRPSMAQQRAGMVVQRRAVWGGCFTVPCPGLGRTRASQGVGGGEKVTYTCRRLAVQHLPRRTEDLAARRQRLTTTKARRVRGARWLSLMSFGVEGVGRPLPCA